MWGNGVTVHNRLQDKMLYELHKEYPEVVRMKNYVTSYVWWLGLDQAIKMWLSCIHRSSCENSPPLHMDYLSK